MPVTDNQIVFVDASSRRCELWGLVCLGPSVLNKLHVENDLRLLVNQLICTPVGLESLYSTVQEILEFLYTWNESKSTQEIFLARNKVHVFRKHQERSRAYTTK